MNDLRDADAFDRSATAAMCALISLPFHYVFWLSAYQLVRYRYTFTSTSLLVVGGMGLVAFVLTWLAWWFSTTRPVAREARLPNAVLYVASVVFAANAAYQFGAMEPAHGTSSMAIAAGALALARSRARR